MSVTRAKILHANQGHHLQVQGVAFTYKVKSEDTDENYVLGEGVIPPQHEEPMHIHHREDEALYILKGQFEITCGGETFPAGPGAFALLPKGVPHRLKNLSNRPGKILFIHSPGGLEEFFEHLSVFGKESVPLEMAKMKELAARYGIEFPSIDRPEKKDR
jgi:mannose-6-phosphate isomerase-like protein (cupin superfamily)